MSYERNNRLKSQWLTYKMAVKQGLLKLDQTYLVVRTTHQISELNDFVIDACSVSFLYQVVSGLALLLLCWSGRFAVRYSADGDLFWIQHNGDDDLTCWGVLPLDVNSSIHSLGVSWFHWYLGMNQNLWGKNNTYDQADQAFSKRHWRVGYLLGGGGPVTAECRIIES